MERRRILTAAAGLAIAALAMLLLLRPEGTGPGRGDERLPGGAPAAPLVADDGAPPPAAPAAPAAPPAPDRGTSIRGVAVDPDGQPVPGAEIAAARDGERRPARAVSDGSGAFVLPAVPVPDGQEGYLVGVRAEGFAPALAGDVRPGGPNLRIVLRRGVRIRGRVTEPSGAPCAGARVRVALRFPGVAKPLGGFEATADEDGRYRFQGLSPVEGTIEATYRGSSSGERPVHPPATGNETGIDLTIDVGGTLEGTVRGTDGSPLAGVNVSAVPTGKRGATFARTDGQGRYVLRGLEPVPHDVRASDPSGRWGEARIPGVTPSRSGVDAVLSPDPDAPGSYSFRAVDPAGKPAGVVLVVRFEVGEPEPMGSGPERHDDAGRYGPLRCQPGRYRVVLRGAAGHASSEEFEVKRGEDTDLGTIRLAPGVLVRGRVLDADGRPCPQARIFVGDGRLPEQGVPAADGGFSLPHLPPGPGVLHVLLPRCDPVEGRWSGESGATIDLGDLRLRPATAILRGTVRDGRKAPVPGAMVRVLQPSLRGMGEIELEGRAGPDGRYEVRSVPAGTWRLAAAPAPSKEGSSFAGGRLGPAFTLAPGEQRETDLSVE
jgi:hypothetical protein